MKVNDPILHQSKVIGKLHTCPNCGSDRWIEHFASHPENEPYNPENEYHWHCLDCGFKDYEYIIF